MISKDVVLKKFQEMYPAVADGTLSVESEDFLDGQRVWNVIHTPQDTNPLLDKIMKAVRGGTIIPKNVQGHEVFELSIYGGTETIAHVKDEWLSIELQDERHALQRSGTLQKITAAVHAQHENVLILEVMAAFSPRSAIVYGVDSITRAEQEFIVSMSKDFQIVEEVRKSPEPEDTGLSM